MTQTHWNKWCIYGHYVSGKCIYIGMGRAWRAFNEHKRGADWRELTRDGYDVEILEWHDDFAACLRGEIELIREFAPVCNKMHNGWVPDAFKKNWKPRSGALQRDRIKPTGVGRPPTPIKCIETGAKFDSLPDAAAQTGISMTSISLVVRGKRKSTCGLTFVRAPA